MANPEHLAKLKEGVEAWNAWRNRESRKDIGVPDLSETDLSGLDLAWANLWNADLQETNLRDANLSFANLGVSMLLGTCLEGATLFEASLIGALLAEADLRRADLSRANLAGTNVRAADFTGAKLARTCLAHIDLSAAKGLSKVRHGGPSTIGTDTLVLSGGRLPSDFLRGCGFSDWELETAKLYDPDLRQDQVVNLSYAIAQLRGEDSAIQFYSCFISYSYTDKPFARRLHDQIQARGIRCWLDEKELKVGQEILPGVLGAIRLHDRVILCCSKASLNSEWVQTELEETFEKEQKEGRQVLLPLNLDGYLLDGWKGPFAVRVRKRLAADFTGWEQDNAKFEEQFERVVVALRTDDAARERAPQSEL